MDWRVVDRDTQMQAFKTATPSFVRRDGVALAVPHGDDKTILKKMISQVVDHKERDTNRDEANAFRNHVVNPKGGITEGIKYFPELFAPAHGLAEVKHHLKETNVSSENRQKIVDSMGEKMAVDIERGERLTTERLDQSFNSAKEDVRQDDER